MSFLWFDDLKKSREKNPFFENDCHPNRFSASFRERKQFLISYPTHEKRAFCIQYSGFQPNEIHFFFSCSYFSLFFLHKAKLFYYYSKDLFFPLAVEALCDAFSAKSVTKEKKGRKEEGAGVQAAWNPKEFPRLLSHFSQTLSGWKKNGFKCTFSTNVSCSVHFHRKKDKLPAYLDYWPTQFCGKIQKQIHFRKGF